MTELKALISKLADFGTKISKTVKTVNLWECSFKVNLNVMTIYPNISSSTLSDTRIIPTKNLDNQTKINKYDKNV